MAVTLQAARTFSPYDSVNVFIGTSPTRTENLCPHKNLHMYVYSNFIYNCPNLSNVYHLSNTPISSIGTNLFDNCNVNEIYG